MNKSELRNQKKMESKDGFRVDAIRSSLLVGGSGCMINFSIFLWRNFFLENLLFYTIFTGIMDSDMSTASITV